VAASRIPTLVAIGHEIDISLAELAADQRASTPSNAAELLVPDRRAVLADLQSYKTQLGRDTTAVWRAAKSGLEVSAGLLHDTATSVVQAESRRLSLQRRVLEAYDPRAALRRGYALLRKQGTLVRSGKQIAVGDNLQIAISDAQLTVGVKRVSMEE